MIAITGLMAYFAYVQRDSVLAVFTGFFALLSIGLIFMTDKSRKNDPERILWIWEWLEWRLIGNYKNKN